MPPFAELMRIAEVHTKEAQSAVQAALEERKRKEEQKRKQQEERERKERELEAKLRQKHFEDEKREQERQKRKEQEKQAIENARQRREEEQRNHLLGIKKSASKWPSSSSAAREDVRRSRMPLDDDDGDGPGIALTREEKRQRKLQAEFRRQFTSTKRSTTAGGYGKIGRKLPGGAVDVTTPASMIAMDQSPGKTVRERLAAMPNTLTKLNVNKRDTRTIDEILQDRAKAKEAKVLDGDSAKGFNDWFGTSKKKDSGRLTASAPGSGANTPNPNGNAALVPKLHANPKPMAVAAARPASKPAPSSLSSTPRASSLDKHVSSKPSASLKSSTGLGQSKPFKSSAVASHSSASYNSRPIPAKKRPRSPSMSESPPPPKKRSTPPGGGGNFRDEIWALFGKSRQSYVERSVFSDDEDMEAGASDLEKEEKYSARVAKKEDEIALQQEKREQEEKERRRRQKEAQLRQQRR